MRRTGIPRGMPRTEGERAMPAQKGATHASHEQSARIAPDRG